MPLKTPAEYVESLRDGRVVFWDGERIDDVTLDPRFRVPLAVAAADYDHGDPEKRALELYRTEEGSEAHRVFQVPRTEEDLLARVALARRMSIVGGVTGVYMALLSVKDEVGIANPRYAENIERLWRTARDHDLRAAEVITDAKGDRSRKAHQQDDPDLYLRIVERRPDGIVVRGAKLHITAASLVHELVVMPTKSMRPEEADYAVSFAIPANAPGVTIINRSFAPAELDPFDYPASAHHSVPEGFVVFDDVFVPWDRVFLAGEAKLAGVFARALGLWERTLGMVEAAERAEILVGAALLVSEQQGKGADAHVQEAISELVCYAQMIRMALEWSCRNFERTPSGMVHPSILGINVGKYYFAANYHTVLRYVHDLGGGLVLTLPKRADLENPESGKYLRKYLHTTADVDVEERMRIYNLIRDLTADAYGGWHLVTTLQAGGGLAAQRVMMNRSFDLAAARAKARRAAGVEG
ncbi:MAG TPA: 4-hydroxyphenylacetate 3-hydroxylase N-terminal domain-containing protein [Myxococcota bacterium]|jgi:4-hydroxybutyryl-CoA dehydratase/vinylacetyl-CoA-Delta-isomerase|nr:4-hydroxyphenylacetate 3-hydroxylase N-terminal domain-containing protein [Myxococcota bacterium]